MADTEAVVYCVLFGTCIVYSLLLERIYHWYTPRRTVYTVMAGCFFIWLALMNIEHAGIPITGWMVLRALVVGGAPIYAWQLWQNWRRSQEAQTG